MSLAIESVANGVRFSVKAVPGSSRDRILGVLGTALKVAVAAPPEGGRANERIVEVLAAALLLHKGAVSLVHGHASPRKVVEVRGLALDEVLARLSLT